VPPCHTDSARKHGEEEIMLNDVQTEKRLAYMLGPTLERHPGRRMSRRAARLAVLGAGTLVLLVLWELFKGH
jgi:hypothetical protein